jgi:hypothetical protein
MYNFFNFFVNFVNSYTPYVHQSLVCTGYVLQWFTQQGHANCTFTGAYSVS